jgi:hypothetical protein
MKPPFFDLTLTCVAVVILGSSGSAYARPRPGEAVGDDPNTQVPDFPAPDLPPPAPLGYVVVEEDLWSQHLDQPGAEFDTVEQDYLAGDLLAAAESIRRGASYLRAEGSRAKTGDRDLLLAVSGALEGLSRRVETRKVTSFDEIGAVFARAHRAVADHYLNLARQAYDGGDARLTGVHLAVAVRNVRQQLIRQNTELDYDLESRLGKLETLAGQLQRPDAVLSGETGKSLAGLAQIIAAHPLAPLGP